MVNARHLRLQAIHVTALLDSRRNALRDQAVRDAIGRGLRTTYSVLEPMPDRLAELVKELDRLDTLRSPAHDSNPIKPAS